jgi:hypothetical protein
MSASSYPYNGMSEFPFDGLPSSAAPLAVDVIQSFQQDPVFGTSYVGGQSHPGDWNVLRCDGSVAKSNSPDLLVRQRSYGVLGSTPDWWAEYNYQLWKYILQTAK